MRIQVDLLKTETGRRDRRYVCGESVFVPEFAGIAQGDVSFCNSYQHKEDHLIELGTETRFKFMTYCALIFEQR
jgi:hypothetical protein